MPNGLKWEEIEEPGQTTTERMRMPTGWAYRTYAWNTETDQPVGMAAWFAPDASATGFTIAD